MTEFSVLRRAFFVCISVTFAGAVPASALNPVENSTLRLLQTSSLPSLPNLTVPSIEGFAVDIRDQLDQHINQLEMYCNSIFAMVALAQGPWDDLLPYNDFGMSSPWYASELRALAFPPDQPTVLKYKHLIIGIYELGCHFGRELHFNYVTAYLSVNRRLIGIISLQIRTPYQVQEHNATAKNSGSLQVMQVAYNASVANGPGTFIDPTDANFVISYDTFGGDRIYIESLFTAFIHALANASPNDVDELGGSVNSVSADGRSFLVIRDASATGRPVLTWGRCIQAIGQLWHGLIGLREDLYMMRFTIEYAGEKLGTGLIKATKPVTGSNIAIARRVND